MLEKLLPASQQLFFFIKTEHFAAYNWRAGLECKHIPDKNFALSVDFDDVCNLDDRVHFSLRKSAFFCGTLDIKAQNTQRSELRVFAFTWQTLDIVIVVNVKLNLTPGFFILIVTNFPFALLDSDPGHSSNVVVYHKPKWERDIALKCSFT